jgi:NAD(P)H dehydrogenase (quinone)
MSKILIVYYSMYSHVHKMAEAVAGGVREIPGYEDVAKIVKKLS